MASFSNIVVMGNLTRDPEKRALPSGAEVTDMNIAVNTYRKGEGDNNQIATFYRVQLFGARGDVIVRNFKKGDSILLSGRDLILREYEKKDGGTGTSLEFTADNFSFVGAKGAGASAGATTDDEVGDEPINLDDIPF